MNLQNDLLLRTLNGENVERPPIWIMRQAGRILPEYRALRAKLDGFKALVKNPEQAATVTVQPVDHLGVDAAIIFSDILVIPECMGLDYQLIEKQGPFFPKTIETRSDIDQLKEGHDAAKNLSYVFDAVQKTKDKLENRVPLIGFTGAPWTLMCYMIEGKGSKTFSSARSWLYANPKASHALLQKLTSTIISYLKLKVEAGVDAVQIFDSWAGVLNQELYAEFCIPYIKQIKESITQVPVILFSKDAHYAIKDLTSLKPNAVGLDWSISSEEMRATYPDMVFQGNMDPCALFGDKDQIVDKTKSIIRKFGHHHIMNLGHGVYPNTPLEGVKTFVNTVTSFRY